MLDSCRPVSSNCLLCGEQWGCATDGRGSTVFFPEQQRTNVRIQYDASEGQASVTSDRQNVDSQNQLFKDFFQLPRCNFIFVFCSLFLNEGENKKREIPKKRKSNHLKNVWIRSLIPWNQDQVIQIFRPITILLFFNFSIDMSDFFGQLNFCFSSSCQRSDWSRKRESKLHRAELDDVRGSTDGSRIFMQIFASYCSILH